MAVAEVSETETSLVSRQEIREELHLYQFEIRHDGHKETVEIQATVFYRPHHRVGFYDCCHIESQRCCPRSLATYAFYQRLTEECITHYGSGQWINSAQTIRKPPAATSEGLCSTRASPSRPCPDKSSRGQRKTLGAVEKIQGNIQLVPIGKQPDHPDVIEVTEELIRRARKGFVELKRWTSARSKERLDIGSQLVAYRDAKLKKRRREKEEEDDVLEDTLKKCQITCDDDKWLSKFYKNGSRVLRRSENPKYSETKNSGAERTLRKTELFFRVITEVVNRLVPFWGVLALLLYNALQVTNYKASKLYKSGGFENFEVYIDSITKSLLTIDVVFEVEETFQVMNPACFFAILERREYRYICEKIELSNLGYLDLEPELKESAKELRERALMSGWFSVSTLLSKEKIGIRPCRVVEHSGAELTIRLRRVRDQSSASASDQHERGDGAEAERQEHPSRPLSPGSTATRNGRTRSHGHFETPQDIGAASNGSTGTPEPESTSAGLDRSFEEQRRSVGVREADQAQHSNRDESTGSSLNRSDLPAQLPKSTVATSQGTPSFTAINATGQQCTGRKRPSGQDQSRLPPSKRHRQTGPNVTEGPDRIEAIPSVGDRRTAGEVDRSASRRAPVSPSHEGAAIDCADLDDAYTEQQTQSVSQDDQRVLPRFAADTEGTPGSHLDSSATHVLARDWGPPVSLGGVSTTLCAINTIVEPVEEERLWNDNPLPRAEDCLGRASDRPLAATIHGSLPTTIQAADLSSAGIISEPNASNSSGGGSTTILALRHQDHPDSAPDTSTSIPSKQLLLVPGLPAKDPEAALRGQQGAVFTRTQQPGSVGTIGSSTPLPYLSETGPRLHSCEEIATTSTLMRGTSVGNIDNPHAGDNSGGWPGTPSPRETLFDASLRVTDEALGTLDSQSSTGSTGNVQVSENELYRGGIASSPDSFIEAAGGHRFFEDAFYPEIPPSWDFNM